MKSLLSYFVTKEDKKEITREITRTNGDKITQITKTTTRYFDIPPEIKEIVKKEVINHLELNKHDKLLKDKEL
jgi:hypothetical protein